MPGRLDYARSARAVPIHIHPTTDLADRVLLPGDPGRALRLAQELIDGPKMLNHNRGLWGYSGPAKADGEPLSIQSTGMGGPSAAIVISELIDLGARRFVRIGTCGALDPALSLGELLVVSEAVCDDGTSVGLGAGERISGSSGLTEELTRAAGAPAGVAEPQASNPATSTGPIVSSDLFYDSEDRHSRWIAAGARAVEMEAATLFALASRRGAEAGALLIVSDVVATGARIGEAQLIAAEIRMGQTAVAALAAAAHR